MLKLHIVSKPSLDARLKLTIGENFCVARERCGPCATNIGGPRFAAGPRSIHNGAGGTLLSKPYRKRDLAHFVRAALDEEA